MLLGLVKQGFVTVKYEMVLPEKVQITAAGSNALAAED
jgi:hypothetical protein